MSRLGNLKKRIKSSHDTDTTTKEIEDNVAVRVEHVSMEFKITKDKIDTLKEYVIRTIKRNKKEKE
jgi:lipopolysaccharide transport system ATP-binding protein